MVYCDINKLGESFDSKDTRYTYTYMYVNTFRMARFDYLFILRLFLDLIVENLI